MHVNVARVATQLRAKANASSVMPNSKSLATQLDIGEQFFRHLELVGDYHTHPYPSLPKLRKVRGWEYSDADSRSLPFFVEEVAAKRHNPPRFSLVVAVAQSGKSRRAPSQLMKNVVQLRVGNLYFIVGCYRILLDASYDHAHVSLRLPTLIA